jgi:AcrR family transcriptional regulator
MARPSQQVDQALLRSGRALFAAHGCAGLSQRLLAEHAGVRPAMVHYHFGSKDGFLRALLQQLYDELFAGLQAGVGDGGTPLQRVRRVLTTLATFVRANHALVLRLAADAAAGHAVVRDFMRDNAPRHLALLVTLLADAQRQGELPSMPPLLAATFLLGAVVAPMVVAPGIAALDPQLPGWPAHALRDAIAPQVSGDAAIAARVDLALAALRAAPPGASSTVGRGAAARQRARATT